MMERSEQRETGGEAPQLYSRAGPPGRRPLPSPCPSSSSGLLSPTCSSSRLLLLLLCSCLQRPQADQAAGRPPSGAPGTRGPSSRVRGSSAPAGSASAAAARLAKLTGPAGRPVGNEGRQRLLWALLCSRTTFEGPNQAVGKRKKRERKKQTKRFLCSLKTSSSQQK